MMRRVCIALACLGLLSGCTTHLAAYDAQAPPQDQPTLAPRLISAATRLLNREMLKPSASAGVTGGLTTASALLYRATRSPYFLSTTRTLADRLLSQATARVGVRRAPSPLDATRAQTANALLAAYAIAHDPSYVTEARTIAATILANRSGWGSVAAGTGVLTNSRPKRIQIEPTADVVLLETRLIGLGDSALRPMQNASLQTIYRNQAAVGRWWEILGTHIPMSIDEWSRTLLDLWQVRDKTAIGIMGAGMPALRDAMLTGARTMNVGGPFGATPLDTALALRATAAYDPTGIARPLLADVLQRQRRDGTISLAPATDAATQSQFALALAQGIGATR